MMIEMLFSYPKNIRIVEVSPRDGLQSEQKILSLEQKLTLIRDLTECGFNTLEVGSFVNPRLVPQMADTREIFRQLDHSGKCHYPVLTANANGLQRAIEAGVQHVALLSSASETFCQKNIHCSIDQSLQRNKQLIAQARQHKMVTRVYISCVFGCHYEGRVDPAQVVSMACQLIEMGADEISLADTVGMATPVQTAELIRDCAKKIPVKRLAVHFHDTYGQALANVLASIQQGVTVIDSSIAGLGGCSFAPGASGNVSTEDLVYMLHGMGISTGLSLQKLIAVGNWIAKLLGRRNASKLAQVEAAMS